MSALDAFFDQVRHWPRLLTATGVADRMLPWLAAGAIGLSCLIGLILVGSLMRAGPGARRRHAVSGPRPSRSWRIIQFACLTLSPWIEPLMPVGHRFRLQTRLRRAGLDQVLTADGFVAGQLLCAGLAMAVTMPAVLALGWSAGASLMIAMIGAIWPMLRLLAVAHERQQRVVRDLPAMLDLLALGLDAGASLPAAMAMAAERGPLGPLRDEFARLLRETHAGRARQEALADMANRLADPGVGHALAAIRSADRQGGDLASMLRDQSEQRRQERFIDAERRAMQAPVKLLLPLLLFIFPGTFLVLLFPIAMRILSEGLL
ncbi:MAG: type II secretion system F family protein [Burkholderiaceae bacterium]